SFLLARLVYTYLHSFPTRRSSDLFLGSHLWLWQERFWHRIRRQKQLRKNPRVTASPAPQRAARKCSKRNARCAISRIATRKKSVPASKESPSAERSR